MAIAERPDCRMTSRHYSARKDHLNANRASLLSWLKFDFRHANNAGCMQHKAGLARVACAGWYHMHYTTQKSPQAAETSERCQDIYHDCAPQLQAF